MISNEETEDLTYSCIDHSSQNIAEDTKLQAIAQLNASISCDDTRLMTVLVDNAKAFEWVTKELWHVIVEMFIDEGQIMR